MSLENKPMKRLGSIVAIGLIACASAVAHAADGSITQSVTGAFDTVIIDATMAASVAAAAAKSAANKALAPADRKVAKSKKDKGDPAAPDKAAGNKSADKTSEKPSDKAAEKAPDKSSGAKGDPDPKANQDPKTGTGPAAKAAADPAKPDGKDTAKPDGKDPTKPADTAAKAPPELTEWPPLDIELARARCTQILKGVNVVTAPEAPFRKGECGAPAPVRVISIGKNPEVMLQPQPVMTCDLAVTLTKWMEKDVQPLARRHLGSEVVRMDSMSDYSCRHAYGRIGNKLSEHGKANALDIRGFVTRKGQTAYVLESWGPNKRDVAKQIAAAKAATAKAETIKLAAEKTQRERAETAAAAAQTPAGTPAAANAPVTRQTIVEGLPRKEDPSKDRGMSLPASLTKEGFGMGPTRLGGPKDAADSKKKNKGKDSAGKRDPSKPDAGSTASLPGAGDEDAAAAPPPKDATSRFLHEAHAAACRTFGTTLGPEANEAHRNHFHVDMAERKIKKICD